MKRQILKQPGLRHDDKVNRPVSHGGLQRLPGAGLAHAGHGLALSQSEPGQADHVSSTALVAALPDVAELHIGHALIGHAVFVGLRQAIADFKAEAIRARRPSAV